MQRRFQRHADHLRLAVRVDGEIHHLRPRLALRQVVLLIPRHTGHGEAFHVVRTLLAVTVNNVIHRPLIAALEHSDMQYIRPDEEFLGYLHHLVFTVLVEDDQVVYVRAIKEVVIFLQTRSDESFFAVHVEFDVVLHYRLHIDRAEVTHLRFARIGRAVFLLQHLKPRDGIVCQMVEVLDARLDLLLQLLHQLVRLLGVELRDAQHPDLKEFLDIFAPHLTDQLGLERRQRLVHKRNQLLLVRRVLVTLLFIDAVLDEDLLQRGVEIFLLQLAFLDLQLPFQQRFGVLRGEFEQVAHVREDRLAVLHHAAVRADVHLAIREGIKRVDGFVR